MPQASGSLNGVHRRLPAFPFPFPLEVLRPTESQVAKAMESLPRFLDELTTPRGSSSHLSVRIPADACGVSGRPYVWITDLHKTDKGLAGSVATGQVASMSSSSTLRFGMNLIIDWLYINNGRLIGAWTIRDYLQATPRHKYNNQVVLAAYFVLANEAERTTAAHRLLDAIGDFDFETSMPLLKDPRLLSTQCDVATQTLAGFKLHKYSPLQYAIDCRNEKVIRQCLELGADPNTSDLFGGCILHVACANDWMSTAILAIERGATIDQPSKSGGTPLTAAAANDHHLIVRMLLERGADIHYRPRCNVEEGEGNSKSVVCSGFRTKETAAVLLEFGADFSQTEDETRYSALHIAALNGDFELAKYLVRNGCSPFSLTSEGETALDLATKYRGPTPEAEQFIAFCK